MKRIISFLLFLLTLTILQGQDDLVTIKLKNGNEITGEIIQGGPDDYYVRIMTNNKKIKDIYTTDIVSIKDEKPLMQSSSSGPKVVFIPYDDPPVAMSPIRPIYPEIAQKVGIEGVVVVQVYIDERGRVKETLILKGVPNTGLDEAAMEAIRKTRFRPAKQRERPVGVWISIPVNFKLK